MAIAIAVSANATLAQEGSKNKKRSAHTEPQRPVILVEANSVSSSNSEKTASTKSSNIYIQSLRDLLAVREREVDVAKENLNKTKQLFAEGIVAKRSVEEAEVALADAQTKADDIRRKLASYESSTVETQNTIEETAETKTDKSITNKVVGTDKKKSSVKDVVQTRPKISKKTSSRKTTKSKPN